MKIVSWNCNGKFREKLKEILVLDADIYVIQECEDPAKSSSIEYKTFAQNYIWTGENKNKGLGVFATSNVQLTENNWSKYCLRNFLSVKINNQFDLVAVWACEPYISEYYIYQSINMENYNDKTVVIGDYNSTAIWDKEHGERTHSAVVEQLEALGLCSAYHYQTKERQGKESIPTFYLYRHPNKGYHIDHCFTSPQNIQSYTVLDSLAWLDKSDHMPVCLEYQNKY